MPEIRPPLGWGFAGIKDKVREKFEALEGWTGRIKGLATSAPTPTANTKVGDIYLNANPTAGGYIGWVCVQVGNQKVFKGFGAIAE